jgi:ADP-dependent NAD(P)H-hydrate dehydratase / NAD(P)H-hydrate epimerase
VRAVLAPGQMAACDRATIAAGTPEPTLVARAAGAVARAARSLMGGVYGRRVVVVAGKGNNGADGRIAAQILRGWGVAVAVHELAAGLDRAALERDVDRCHLFVDAMYGTGFRGHLDGDAELATILACRAPRTLAVDIPSGVDGSTGAVDGSAVAADATITFAALKPGLLLEPGRSHAGDVWVADIGVAPDAAGPVDTWVLEADDVAALLPRREPDEHKWSSGLLVVAGSRGMTGAPLLVSRAALHAEAGMVVCALPGDDAATRASGSEVVTRALPATPDGGLARGASDLIVEWAARFRAVVIGPGLGRADDTMCVVREVVARLPVPVVVDADALPALGADRSALHVRRDAGHPSALLTPHTGEFAALTGSPVPADRIAAARHSAADLGAVMLLKGPGTVVASPSGACFVNPTGGPSLASAGTGDVLAGISGAFLARGLEAEEAGAVAAWVHGRTADEAGEGLVASDLVDGLPRTLASLQPTTQPPARA